MAIISGRAMRMPNGVSIGLKSIRERKPKLQRLKCPRANKWASHCGNGLRSNDWAPADQADDEMCINISYFMFNHCYLCIILLL